MIPTATVFVSIAVAQGRGACSWHLGPPHRSLE
jgi:hypothetical protein